MGSQKEILAKWESAYKKRFKCPECNAYTLHVEHDSFAECEEGCSISDKETIVNIVDEDDFEGYFTDEELQNKFY